MLRANKIASAGFARHDRFEVIDSDAAIGTIDATDSTFALGDRKFSITRSGLFAPQLRLKLGEALFATASQKPFRNHYTLGFNGREWTFKAIDLLAAKFGLFEQEVQKGSVSGGPYTNRLKDITADLPDEVPQEIQMFLLALFVIHLTAPSN
jgi:hypothetical protein